MVKRRGFPDSGENVMVTVIQISPYSALCRLDEYPGKEGMIHVSEVSGKWVRDIKKFVKKNKQYAAKVMRVDEERGHINLSLKRLSKKAGERKLQEFKKEERAEKMLELVGKEFGLNLEQAYEKIGFDLQENFGDMFRVFEEALKSTDNIIRRGVEEKYAEIISKIAKENIQKKKIKIKTELSVKFYTGDGVEKLREFLKNLRDKYKFEIKYISAPRYSIEILSDDPKNDKRKLKEQLTKTISNIKDGEFNFKIEGEK